MQVFDVRMNFIRTSLFAKRLLEIGNWKLGNANCLKKSRITYNHFKIFG
jgi:hypothetical protein